MSLTREEKVELIYEIMQFAIASDRVQAASSPQIDTFSLIRAVMRDGNIRANGRQTLIQELRKFKELWGRVRPFIVNTDSCCRTPGCYHYGHSHKDGKCEGTNRHWSNGKLENVPCDCAVYINKAKW